MWHHNIEGTTMQDTIDILRRNAFTAAIGSQGLYWFDLVRRP
jgi:hypothetical protein